MPDGRKHRGPGPQDAAYFGAEARPDLVAAVSDLSWLMSRGYGEPSAVKLVGDRYRLVERQRVAVLRSACSDAALADRRSRRIDPGALRGRSLRIDGFNLILTLESALGGGVVLGGRDGCFRDLASVHGTYRRVEETLPALELATRWLAEWGAGPCLWLLDAPVSNSGRLAAMIRAVNPGWTAEVVPDPDRLLSQPGDAVVTADSAILDRSGPWVNLARALVEAGVPAAFLADLG
ncbi:DUF434 domain-containing protein [Fimbriiglobus ruber]|uniref:DUF434 domain-containing protein n=1 Tax=Fimbriiglobus ruber TaxID=1908690 RepID=A0A225D9W0_9BACT|nr:DUF434 domain-containing protein [Fimbriiglobus ruber]OWK38252.1 hypothetical protein FRUB_07372 [Fimbriiglobus ruber]